MSLRILISLLALLLLGCPSSGGDDDDSAADDDDATADDDDATADDDDSADDDDDTPEDLGTAIVLYGSFGSDATVATIDVNTGTVSDDVLGLVGSDWTVSTADGSVWLVGRTGTDAVRRYDDLDFSAPVLEFSTAAGTNPQGVAVCGDHIFVPRFDTTADGSAGADVAMFDLATGGPLGAVDLSPYEEGTDGSSEPHRPVLLGDSIYVALQRLDRDNFWTADAVGKVVEISCADGSISRSFDVGPNPFVSVAAADPSIVTVKTDGGLQIIELDDGQVVNVLDETTLAAGSDIIDVAPGDEFAAIAVEVDWAQNHLECFGEGTTPDGTTTPTDGRNWGLDMGPDGNVWALWIDHWATPDDVEPGGVTVHDPSDCSQIGDLVTFAADPIVMAFL